MRPGLATSALAYVWFALLKKLCRWSVSDSSANFSSSSSASLSTGSPKTTSGSIGIGKSVATTAKSMRSHGQCLNHRFRPAVALFGRRW